jgi:hypothetical protein
LVFEKKQAIGFVNAQKAKLVLTETIIKTQRYSHGKTPPILFYD